VDERIDASATREPAELVIEEAITIRPSPKTGIEPPIKRANPNEVVGRRPRKMADHTPAGMPTTIATRRAASESRSLARNESKRSSDTGRRVRDAPTQIAVNESGDVGEVTLGECRSRWFRSERLDLLIGRVVAERRGDRIGGDNV